MRATLLVTLTAIAALGACSRAPHQYPEAARLEFNAQCPAGDPVCDCIWDEIIADVPYEDYEAAMQRYRDEGLMDPRISHARTVCRERL